MRRIVLLAALAAVPLPMSACDDGGAPDAAAATVAVGSLPGLLTTVATAPTVATTTTVTTVVTTTPATEEVATTGVAATTEPSTIEPSSTVFVDVLDGLVEDDRPYRVATVSVRDDTGRLRLAVPREWSQHRTEPAHAPDGSRVPSLAASPDLTAFLDDYGTPGITALVVAADPDAALDAYAFGEDCTGRRRADYVGDRTTGRFDVWESCGGTADDIVTLAVQPDGAAESVLLLVQVTGSEDLAALDAALATLTLAV